MPTDVDAEVDESTDLTSRFGGMPNILRYSRRALVTDLVRGDPCVDPVVDHEPARLVETKVLLELERGHRGQSAEMMMQRGLAHAGDVGQDCSRLRPIDVAKACGLVPRGSGGRWRGAGDVLGRLLCHVLI